MEEPEPRDGGSSSSSRLIYGLSCFFSTWQPGVAESANVAFREKVPVINFSLGKGDWLVQRARVSHMSMVGGIVASVGTGYELTVLVSVGGCCCGSSTDVWW